MSAVFALLLNLVQWILPRGVGAVWRHFREARPARKLLDPCNTKAVLFIYSTVVMKKYTARNTREIDIERDREVHGEGDVASYRDVLGYFHLRTLLSVAGIQEEAIDGKRCDEWVDQDWEKNLILLGSPISNSKTQDALKGCGYNFNDQGEHIRRELDPPKQWSATEQFDYCVVAKKVNKELGYAYIVVAGLGPLGTQAGCHYLAKRYRQLVKRYSDSPFAIVLKVERARGYIGWDKVDSLSVS